jgi:hypothetical protein
MKDVTHHLRYIQKKVIQSARKENSLATGEGLNGVATPNEFNAFQPGSRRKLDENKRTSRT